MLRKLFCKWFIFKYCLACTCTFCGLLLGHTLYPNMTASLLYSIYSWLFPTPKQYICVLAKCQLIMGLNGINCQIDCKTKLQFICFLYWFSSQKVVYMTYLVVTLPWTVVYFHRDLLRSIYCLFLFISVRNEIIV